MRSDSRWVGPPGQAFRLGSVALLWLAAVAASAQTLERAPYLQMGTPDAMTIRWRTDVPTASTVRYGTAANDLSLTIEEAVLTTEHELRLESLSPDTRYYYSVGTPTQALAGGDADHFFKTSPPVGADDPVSIWVLGDPGVDSPEAAAVQQAYRAFMNQEPADLTLTLGDNAYINGLDIEFTEEFFAPFQASLRQTVLWPAPGNHDYSGAGSSNPVTQQGPYYEAFTLPTQGEAGGVPSGTETYYSFDYANIHFVVLNTYQMPIDASSAVYTWLVADLDANQADWTIVAMHFPPYSRGKRDSDTDFHMKRAREIYSPVFEAKGVDLVLTAHSHSYQRSRMIDGHYDVASTFNNSHLVDGGDGSPLGDGAYIKAALGPVPNTGTVYVVNGVGASALEGAGSFDHPVMLNGFTIEGSNVINIEGGVLDYVFVSRTGAVLDRFQMLKGPDAVPEPSWTAQLVLGGCFLGGLSRLRRHMRPPHHFESRSNASTHWCG